MDSFRHGRRVSTAILSTLLMATLAGCGGGGGGGGTTPPPTSNPNPNPPIPTMSRLTLTGTVTDAPIANAVVTATIGQQTFTTNADANGNYSLLIEVEEDATNGFVILSARGVGSQSYVEFTSLAGTFASLQSQAGSDETLSNTENFATQITNVSTALAVLLQEANGGQPVTSEALLRTLSASLNSQEVLDLATAIKLLVDQADNYPMPDGQTSLKALLSNSAAREQFVDATYDQNPTTFADTQSAIVNDSTLSRPVSAGTLPARLTAAMLSDATDFSFIHSNRVSSYAFNDDGTGTASGGTWNTGMTWTIQGSSVQITYDAPVAVTGAATLDCDGGPRQVEALYSSAAVQLTLLNDRVLAITQTSDITSPYTSECQPRQVTTTVARTILHDSDFQQLDVASLQGATRSIYVYDALAGVNADVADLNADGTGSTSSFGKQFTWAIDERASVLTATFDDGTVARYRALRQVDEVTTDLYYEIETAQGLRVDARASVYADPELPLVFTPSNVPGRYYLFGIGEENGEEVLSNLRMRFDANGGGSREYDFGTLPSYTLFWHIDGEDLVVQRTHDEQGAEFGCQPGTMNCLVYEERRIVPLSLRGSRQNWRDGARFYWMEYRRTDYPVNDNTVPRTFMRFYDYEPLDATPAPVPASSKSAVTAAGSARQLRFQGATMR